MNEITTSKVQLKDALTAQNIEVLEYIPERIVPPIVVINNGQPYLVPESIKSEYILALELNCIAETATNEVASEKLDELIESVLNALPSYARLLRVGKPYELAVNNAAYLAADISVNLSITI